MPYRDNHTVLLGVGENPGVDHVAIQVQKGMMIAATTLFAKLGYKKVEGRDVKGEWGEAIFMSAPYSPVRIQLSELADDFEVITGGNHIGICVDNPKLVAAMMREWLHWGGVSSSVEEVPGGKYFLSVPAILTQKIEFVPNE